VSAYRKIGALIVRNRRMLLITATADPDVYSMPGGPPEKGWQPEDALAEHLRIELGVEITSSRLFGRYSVTSLIDGATVQSTIYRAEIDGEPRTAQLGRRILWTSSLCDINASTTVSAVWCHASSRGLVGDLTQAEATGLATATSDPDHTED
jgi:ADP-ribose pyrophosphatase YjhB (NUDIX family)